MDGNNILNEELIQKTVNYHGQQLQKLWELERGNTDFQKHGSSIKFDFATYQQRAKNLDFSDRGKRLTVQQFIARKADQLFDNDNGTNIDLKPGTLLPNDEEESYSAILPPFDTFLPLEKQSRVKHFFQCVRKGDYLICSIMTKSPSGMLVKVLCTDSEPFRFAADLNIKAFCPTQNMPIGGMAVDKKGTPRALMLNEAIRVELVEINPDSEKLLVSMVRSESVEDDSKLPPLGFVYAEDLPTAYKKCQEQKNERYDDILQHNIGFANPNNTELLAKKAGILQDQTHLSFCKSLRHIFPSEEYAQELRQVQASKWAFKSVAEGIAHFKAERHSEAFQCLNRALSLDRRNVEGLVARGALYANSGSFQKAIEDFELALKINPAHQNARKYMGETLVALGRQYEEENNMDEAMKSYQTCLDLLPYHEEAQNSILYLQNKRAGKLMEPIAPNTDDLIPGGGLTANLQIKDTLKQLLKAEQEEKSSRSRSKKKKDRKKKSRRSKKHRHRSSSSSSSSSSASASSSSSSSSSSASGSSDKGSSRSRSPSPRRHRKSSSKKHSKESRHEKSLSPISKRMAMMDTSQDSEALARTSLPYSFEENKAKNKDSDEERLRRFIEINKGEPDFQEKLTKFLEESAKWKKDKKSHDKESKKKKKKDKMKKDKGKKKKKSKDKRKSSSSRMDDIPQEHYRTPEMKVKEHGSEEYSPDDYKQIPIKMVSPPPPPQPEKSNIRQMLDEDDEDMDDLDAKLRNYYAKIEKDNVIESVEHVQQQQQELISYPHLTKNYSDISSKYQPDVMDFEAPDQQHQQDLFDDMPEPKFSRASISENEKIAPTKWKMQIAPSNSSSKMKEQKKLDKGEWEDDYYEDEEKPSRFGSRFNKNDASLMDPDSLLPPMAPPTPEKRERVKDDKREKRSRSRSNGSFDRRRSRRSPSYTRGGRSPPSRSVSRSRSRSYSRSYSRSRSGSRGRRSRSHERPRRHYMNKRGTYYKPGFHPHYNPYRGRRPFRGRPFRSRGGGGRGRARYYNNYRDFRRDHDRRRYSRSPSDDRRSEDRDRRRSRRSRSYSGEPRDRNNRDRRPNSPRDRDRQTEEHPPTTDNGYQGEGKRSSDYIDRKVFEGKWAEEGGAAPTRHHDDDDSLPPLPPGTEPEQYDA